MIAAEEIEKLRRYALKILDRYRPAPNKPIQRQYFVEVTCAYCGGSGADLQYGSVSG